MQPQTEGFYEMVMYRNPALEKTVHLSCTFPDVEEWPTKDLFQIHPTKPGLWRFHDCIDDIIVLSNAEKFNPAPSEAAIQSHPSVSGAMIVGQGRFQLALLVEIRRGSPSPVSRDDLWSTIEKANDQAQAYGRIM